MKINNIVEISTKELKSFYDNLSGYLLTAIFLALLYFLFLKPFFITQTVSLRDLFQWIPWLFVVFIPAITMGSFAKEYENQTIEYLLSKPLEKREIIIGKIVGAFTFVFISVLLTTPLIFFVNRLGNLDLGETFAGYFGVFMLGLTLSAIGVAISSVFKNQITAFIFSVVLMFALTIIGSELTAINLPLQITNILANLSITEHFYSLTRGVFKASDLVYFFILILFSIGLAEINLNREKGVKTRGLKNNISTLIAVSASIVLILLVSRFMYGRIDLTSSKKYTLSDTTKAILSTDKKVTIEVYASDNLPQQFKYRYNELKNILDDYKTQAGSKLDIQYLSATGKEAELQQQGISPAEFRVYGNDQLQAQRGYLGVLLKNDEGQTESIPLVQDVNQLEYELSRLIYRLKNTEKSKIAFASGNGERSTFNEYQALSQLLESDYQIETVLFPSVVGETKDQPNLSQYKMLVIADPTDPYTLESKQKIADFLQNGGSVIYLAENAVVDNELATAVKPENVEGDILTALGASINADLVYDIQNHGMVTVETAQGLLPIRYPFFVFAQKASDSVKNLPDAVLAGWPSSLTVDQNWEVLYETSDFGGKQTDTYNIAPDQQLSQENLTSYPIIAIRRFDNGGKAIIASDARLFENQFVSGIEQNAVLALSLFEEAFQGIGLSSIKAKNLTENQMLYVNQSNKNLVNYGAPAVSVLLLGLIGFARYKRRQNLIKYYSKFKSA